MTVSLFPHQRALVDRLLGSSRGYRAFLQSPPGAGASVAVAAFLGELAATSSSNSRVLIVAPPASTAMRQAMSAEWGKLTVSRIDAQTYRELENLAQPDQSPWFFVSCGIVSPSFLRDARLEAMLDVEWDALILDEAHLASPMTRRGRVAQSVWNSDRVGLCLALSHNAQPDWLVGSPNVERFHWIRSELTDLRGRQLYAQRQIITVRYKLSSQEKTFRDRLHRNLSLSALASDRGRFIARQLHTLAGSSPHAIEQALMRIRARLSAPKIDQMPLFDQQLLDAQQPIFAEETPEVDSAEPLTRESCSELLDLLGDLESDSKWDACWILLREIDPGTKSRVLLITDYVHTADYLEIMTEEQEWNVSVATGRDPRVTEKVLQTYSKGGLLIATPIAVEAANFPKFDHIIHFDIPQSSEGLVRRFLSLEAGRMKADPVIHYLLVEDSSEGVEEATRVERELALIDLPVEPTLLTH